MLPKISLPYFQGIRKNLYCASFTHGVQPWRVAWWAAFLIQIAAGCWGLVVAVSRAAQAVIIFCFAVICWAFVEARERRMARKLGRMYEGPLEDFD